jgi:hypothetical protein
MILLNTFMTVIGGLDKKWHITEACHLGVFMSLSSVFKWSAEKDIHAVAL